ncbi:hypothetical protein E5673_14225 [Sphingomonas sp. PAMC26645]|uniref:hypothetical protein n=1 Tax=Sphingomonas sp. PAMC26645 TaxID=2565555 RepID=UPI00109DA637|nr:hypothetical protein [Sphingomonas sp. PAMC26645]QCB43237.1 hypothetical protein E5673_14225 [Sphingomonas sp. PAMC26645]
MIVDDEDRFGSAQLRKRIRAICGNLDIGNGTPVADALWSALNLDFRIGGRMDGAAVLNALTDDEIDNLACEMMRIYGERDSECTLPLGTIMASDQVGDVRFGHERWLLDAGRPGLHAMADIRRDAHGPNFELLRSHITRLTSNLPCDRLGLPSPVFIVDTNERHLLHFRPCIEAGGVVLQRWTNCTDAPRFAAASPTQILEFAESIVADMQALWDRREAIAARAEAVRAIAEAVAAEHGVEVLLVAVDLSQQRDSARVDMEVHYLAIDEAMRVGPVLGFFPGEDDYTAEFHQVPTGVSHRSGELAKLHQLGADGRIDDMAAAVAAAAPGGAKAVFAKLVIDYQASFEMSTSNTPMFVTLYWRDGTIKADISMAGKLEWYGTRLEIFGHFLPETASESLPGRTVDSVALLPFPCACRIERVRDLVGGTRLDLAIGTRLINLTTGRIWDEPASDR